MAQLAPFLKPPSGGGTSQSASAVDDRPRTGLSNYLRRLGALIFDFLFLFLLLRVMAWAFFDQLAQRPILADSIATWFVVLYFFLGASPASKGQTIGKMLVAIRVTDYEGKTPGFGQALLRTVLLYPGIWVAQLAHTFVFNDPGSFRDTLTSSSIGLMLNFTLFIACSFAIVFNPFKQGHHDFLSKTLVRYKSAPSLSFDELASLMGDGWRKLHIQPQLMSGGTFVILLALLLWQITNHEIDAKKEQEFRIKYDIIQSQQIENASLEKGFLPADGDPQDEKVQREFFAAISDKESSSTIKLQMTVIKKGQFDETIEELEPKAESIANAYRDEALAELPATAIVTYGDGVGITNLRQRPINIEVKFVQHLPLYFLASFELKELGSYTFPFPPIEPFVSNNSESSKEEPETNNETAEPGE